MALKILQGPFKQNGHQVIDCTYLCYKHNKFQKSVYCYFYSLNIGICDGVKSAL